MIVPINEVRVGNWFEACFIGKFQATQNDFAEWDSIAAGGIPLTPEMLKNIVPQKHHFDGGPYFILPMNEKQSFAIHFYADQSFSSIDLVNAGKPLILITLAIKLNYLHQLQNLYHALTGSELPVNLKEKV